MTGAAISKVVMSLDFGTLTAAGGLVAFVSGLLLVFAWTQFARGAAALWLGLSHLTAAVAIMLLAFGAVQPILPLLAQPLFVAAACLALASILAFEGPRSQPFLQLAAGLSMVVILAGSFVASDLVPPRIVQLSITSTLFVTSAWMLWSRRREELAARAPLAAILLVHGMMNAVGFAEAVFREALPSGVPSLEHWYGLIHIESMLYFVGTTLFLVALLKERSEAGHLSAALTDPLTGLPNRRAFFDRGRRMVERCHRESAPCSLLAIDLDRFKVVNDTFGHATGDRVLQVFAEVAKAQLRSNDLVGRLGGEEFAVLLPRTHGREAAQIANRLREGFAHACRRIGDDPVQGTLSVGVTIVLGSDTDLRESLERADSALYRAKLNGRDRVEVDTSARSVDVKRVAGS